MPASLPAFLPGYGPLRAYDPQDRGPRGVARAPTPPRPVAPKTLRDIEAAFDACGIGNGATLSFHHHLRNGDATLNAVLSVAGRRGLRDLRIAASALFPVHAPLVEHIQNGVVGAIWCDYANGPVAEAITAGALATPVLLQTHGGRARAIAVGALEIDVAFIAAPVADVFGAATGREGRAACGPLGYPQVDAAYARQVVVLAEELRDAALTQPEIAAAQVDHVAPVLRIGEPDGILSGATRRAADAVGLQIAETAAAAIAASGVLVDGFSFQTGAGGVSLAAVERIGAEMDRRGVRGDFISGGITGAHVDLVNRGLFARLRNVQSFDRDAVRSFSNDSWHESMSAAEYASPIHPAPAVDDLSAMLLGASEVDRSFNVNVTTGGDGRIIGGPGGHPDAAAGAALTIATTRLTGGGYPKLVDAVGCVTTPGADVDLVVTEMGVAVNPARPELTARLIEASIAVVEIDELIAAAAAAAAAAERAPVRPEGDIVALVEYRDGSIIDVIRRALEEPPR